MRISTVSRCAEGLGVGAGLALLGLLNPGDPFFLTLGFLPQALASVLAASLLGPLPGALSLAAAFLAELALFAYGRRLGLGLPPQEGGALLAAARLPAAATLGCILVAGWLRDSAEIARARLQRRFRDSVRRNVQLRKMNEALADLSHELERRVSTQRDSVSGLYARIRKMDSNKIDHVLAGLLEAVIAFSQASSAAIYEYAPKRNALLLHAHTGTGPEPIVPMEGTVEGWVFRFDTPFSLRMAGERLDLDNVDARRSVLAYPLRAGDLPWGVLNVSEMPFYRYNSITEKNLEVVVSLSSAYIKKAIDYRDRVLMRPRDEITGLPGFDDLVRILSEEIMRRAERGLSVAVVLAELLGFEEMAEKRSMPKAFVLLGEFAEGAVAGEEGRALAFLYKERGQLAFVLHDLDRRGASLFALGLMEKAGTGDFLIDGAQAYLEIAIGMSAFTGSAEIAAVNETQRAEALLAEAETVLSLSRGAFTEGRGSCR